MSKLYTVGFACVLFGCASGSTSSTWYKDGMSSDQVELNYLNCAQKAKNELNPKPSRKRKGADYPGIKSVSAKPQNTPWNRRVLTEHCMGNRGFIKILERKG